MNLYIHNNVKLCLPLSNIINKYLDPTFYISDQLWEYGYKSLRNVEFRTLNDIITTIEQIYGKVNIVIQNMYQYNYNILIRDILVTKNSLNMNFNILYIVKIVNMNG
jgi:hypothetical protein